MASYGYTTVLQMENARWLKIHSTDSALLEWLPLELKKKANPSACLKWDAKLTSGEVFVCLIDRLERDKTGEGGSSWLIFRILCSQGWEPFSRAGYITEFRKKYGD